MHWIANCLCFQQMLEGLGEVQRLGRYLDAKNDIWKIDSRFTTCVPIHDLSVPKTQAYWAAYLVWVWGREQLWLRVQHKNHTAIQHRPLIGPIQIQSDAYKLAATLRANTGLELAAVLERNIFLSFPPLSLVWVPPTRRHSLYPCPKFDSIAI